MPRFFVESVSGGQVILTGPDAAHMCRSLRMKPGDTVTPVSYTHLDVYKRQTQ